MTRPRASWATAVATVLYVGRVPFAPGTAGALVAIPFAYFLSPMSWIGWLVLLLGLTVGSTVLVEQHLQTTDDPDPSEVVADEFVGQLIALAVVPMEAVWVLAAFGLFRLFDIWKPGPVGWAERSFKGAVGVMADDIVAGLIAASILVGMMWWLGPS